MMHYLELALAFALGYAIGPKVNLLFEWWSRQRSLIISGMFRDDPPGTWRVVSLDLNRTPIPELERSLPREIVDAMRARPFVWERKWLANLTQVAEQHGLGVFQRSSELRRRRVR